MHAYKSSTWRSATLSERIPPPTGVVSGPLIAMRCSRITPRVSSGSQLPFWLNDFSPAKTSCHTMLRLPPDVFATAASKTLADARQMSGPVPSPSMKGMIGWSGTIQCPSRYSILAPTAPPRRPSTCVGMAPILPQRGDLREPRQVVIGRQANNHRARDIPSGGRYAYFTRERHRSPAPRGCRWLHGRHGLRPARYLLWQWQRQRRRQWPNSPRVLRSAEYRERRSDHDGGRSRCTQLTRRHRQRLHRCDHDQSRLQPHRRYLERDHGGSTGQRDCQL